MYNESKSMYLRTADRSQSNCRTAVRWTAARFDIQEAVRRIGAHDTQARYVTGFQS